MTPAEAAQDARRSAPDVYRSIGVKPVVNARGTFTIVSGSLMLPEVRAAMDAAARQHVHLDELAEAIGARLATLTGAGWGLVTAGCSAALTHATAGLPPKHYGAQSGDSLSFTFTGKLAGERMSGELDMGEYLGARWTARRHQ